MKDLDTDDIYNIPNYFTFLIILTLILHVVNLTINIYLKLGRH